METLQIHHTTLDILLIESPASYGVKGGSASGSQSPGRSAKQLELGYRVALAKANAKQLESIAFQGLDSQICGCTAQDAADTALSTVKEFLDSNPNTSLRRVLFMQYDREAYEAFCGGLRELGSNRPDQEALSQSQSA
jgi:O-acetyl-ADP-ribose deacetylase (regulator of RNase III)